MSGFVDDHKTGNFELELDTALHIADGLMANQYRLKAGQSMGKHVHDYTHLSILAKGIVRLEKFNSDDVEPFEKLSLDATLQPLTVVVAANIYHRITAIEDADWFCIHAEQG